MCFLFCFAQFARQSLMLFYCPFALAFIADLTVRFACVSLATYALLARKTCWQDLHTFSLSGTIVSHCGHTLLGGMLIKYQLDTSSQKQNGHFPPRGRIYCARMRIFHSDKNGRLRISHTMLEPLYLCNVAFSDKTARNSLPIR